MSLRKLHMLSGIWSHLFLLGGTPAAGTNDANFPARESLACSPRVRSVRLVALTPGINQSLNQSRQCSIARRDGTGCEWNANLDASSSATSSDNITIRRYTSSEEAGSVLTAMCGENGAYSSKC